MTLKVVGAGLGRTGTNSLKIALENLLAGPCYHMVEVFPRPEHVPLWHEAVNGGEADWEELFSGFVAAVDWPAAAAWRPIHAAFPEALVLLSTRASSDEWWTSYSNTILATMLRGPGPDNGAWFGMADVMLHGFSPDPADREKCVAAYEAHNAAVRATVPPEQLIDWTPADGREPICRGLGLAVPDEPFPYTNTTEEFRAMTGLAPPSSG